MGLDSPDLEPAVGLQDLPQSRGRTLPVGRLGVAHAKLELEGGREVAQATAQETQSHLKLERQAADTLVVQRALALGLGEGLDHAGLRAGRELGEVGKTEVGAHFLLEVERRDGVDDRATGGEAGRGEVGEFGGTDAVGVEG